MLSNSEQSVATVEFGGVQLWRRVFQGYENLILIGKGKAVPVHAWIGERAANRIFRQSAHEGGKVVSPTHRPPLPPGKVPHIL